MTPDQQNAIDSARMLIEGRTDALTDSSVRAICEELLRRVDLEKKQAEVETRVEESLDRIEF